MLRTRTWRGLTAGAIGPGHTWRATASARPAGPTFGLALAPVHTCAGAGHASCGWSRPLDRWYRSGSRSSSTPRTRRTTASRGVRGCSRCSLGGLASVLFRSPHGAALRPRWLRDLEVAAWDAALLALRGPLAQLAREHAVRRRLECVCRCSGFFRPCAWRALAASAPGVRMLVVCAW